MLSATTTFIVRLIAERLFHADAAIGVDLVERDGRITGEIEGVPSFQEGKIVRLTEFLRPMGLAPSDALALDEPFTGLDADNRAAAQRCVARAAREKIVLLVSHEDDALAGAEVRLQ